MDVNGSNPMKSVFLYWDIETIEIKYINKEMDPKKREFTLSIVNKDWTSDELNLKPDLVSNIRNTLKGRVK
jgi:serine protease inhibitor